jgi:hypothetical protein
MSKRKLSLKQRQIVSFVGADIRKKSEIVDKFSHWYYCNESKHIGDLLTRLVRSGWLERPSIGHYSSRTKVLPSVDRNQLGLFEAKNKAK